MIIIIISLGEELAGLVSKTKIAIHQAKEHGTKLLNVSNESVKLASFAPVAKISRSIRSDNRFPVRNLS